MTIIAATIKLFQPMRASFDRDDFGCPWTSKGRIASHTPISPHIVLIAESIFNLL
ncbi:hypothetical protein [Paenibacillus elgii]|uniref:hypothetical protein n=1 Tax=Paenibacillus elgii TaxID=189691 RepID=UPI001CB9893B|nr:hypothetical protein [Paenibacillus elgii]